MRESHLSIREKLEKRAQIGFTGTFDFHREKKTLICYRSRNFGFNNTNEDGQLLNRKVVYR